MYMHPLSCCNVLLRIADPKTVFNHLGSGRNIADCHLVSRRDRFPGGNLLCSRQNGLPGCQFLQCHDNIIIFIDLDKILHESSPACFSQCIMQKSSPLPYAFQVCGSLLYRKQLHPPLLQECSDPVPRMPRWRELHVHTLLHP